MKVLKVKDFKHTDPSRYVEGDLFIADEHIGILHKGKIERLILEPDLKHYVTEKEVKKIIKDTLKKVEK